MYKTSIDLQKACHCDKDKTEDTDKILLNLKHQDRYCMQ